MVKSKISFSTYFNIDDKTGGIDNVILTVRDSKSIDVILYVGVQYFAISSFVVLNFILDFIIEKSE